MLTPWGARPGSRTRRGEGGKGTHGWQGEADGNARVAGRRGEAVRADGWSGRARTGGGVAR